MAAIWKAKKKINIVKLRPQLTMSLLLLLCTVLCLRICNEHSPLTAYATNIAIGVKNFHLRRIESHNPSTRKTILTLLLVLSGDIELNPGPPRIANLFRPVPFAATRYRGHKKGLSVMTVMFGITERAYLCAHTTT